MMMKPVLRAYAESLPLLKSLESWLTPNTMTTQAVQRPTNALF